MRAYLVLATLTFLLPGLAAAPSAVVELVLDVPFATAIVGEPVDCALRIQGPRIDEKIFDGHPEYLPGAKETGAAGFVYRFRFVPPAPGSHPVGPFLFGIDTFRLRSNVVEVVAHPMPADPATVRVIPARSRVRAGERVAVRVDNRGKAAGVLRLKPAAGYDVLESPATDGSPTFVLKLREAGTIVLSADAFEGLPKGIPFWTVPIEVAPAGSGEADPLPAPLRPGEEATEVGFPVESP